MAPLSLRHTARLLIGGGLLCILPLSALAAPALHFPTPEAAVKGFRDALAAGKPEGLVAIVGEENRDLVLTGDPATDADTFSEALGRVDLFYYLDPVEENKRIVLVGAQAWPFPIPIIREAAGWRFAGELGREEMLNRRIGSNELYAISVMRAFLEAQQQYALADRNGDGVREYAQRIGSTPGKRDGLYWTADSAKGEEPSPWGPLIATTSIVEGKHNEAQGYRGYRYRVLTRQTAVADGGTVDYLVNGRMLAGFALVAYPADYDDSGITTFIVNRNGRIYERDLGPETAAIAQAMTAFDPADGWTDVDR